MANSDFAFWNVLRFLKNIFGLHLVESQGAKPMDMEGLIVYQIGNEMLMFIGFYKHVEYSDSISLLVNMTASVSTAQSDFRSEFFMF